MKKLQKRLIGEFKNSPKLDINSEICIYIKKNTLIRKLMVTQPKTRYLSIDYFINRLPLKHINGLFNKLEEVPSIFELFINNDNSLNKSLFYRTFRR